MSQADQIGEGERSFGPPRFVETPVNRCFRVTIARSTLHRRYAYILRHDAYVRELGSVPPQDAGTLDGEERDAFDRAGLATTFISWLDDLPVGTVRVLAPLNGQLLLETGPEGFALPSYLPRATTREPSRQVAKTIAHPRFGLIRQSHLLLAAACAWSLDQGMTHWGIAWQEDFFRRLTQKHRWPLYAFGVASGYHHTRVVPAWCDLEELWSFLEKNIHWPD